MNVLKKNRTAYTLLVSGSIIFTIGLVGQMIILIILGTLLLLISIPFIQSKEELRQFKESQDFSPVETKE